MGVIVLPGYSTSSRPYNSGDVIYKAYLDHAGNMWFASSQEGVYRYDGNEFVNFNTENGLCGSEVTDIIEDKDGFFWFGTDSGLCRFDGQNFHTIPLPDYPKQSEWLDRYYPMINPEVVSQLLQDKNGNFWIGSNCGGLHVFDGKTFQSYLQEKGNLMPDSMYHNCISAIVEDKNGHIWIGSFSHGGISEYDGGNFIHHSLDDGIGDGMISSIYIDSKDNIWAGTRNGGIYRFDGHSFVPLHDLGSNKLIPMAKFFGDSRGTLWMSSYARGGVYPFNGEGFQPFLAKNSEKLLDVMCMAEDKEGHIWFGGRYGLLWRYDGSKLEDFTKVKREE
ncbi:MAG: two-component regulator propeller domain-containing protein [Bacteroidota bacterium]